jgi:hypothetical protein
MSEWNYVIAAYAVAWSVIVGLAVYLGVRKRNARHRLAAAERQ